MGAGPGALSTGTGVARYAAARDEPWRNGRGTTRRLHPAGPGTGSPSTGGPAGARAAADPGDGWRVSVAALERAGEFSAFSGADRVFTPVDAPVDLTVDGRPHRVLPGVPVRFAGEAAVVAALPAGPTRAVNVITARSRCRADVRVSAVDGLVAPTTALVLLHGEGITGGGERVGPLDLVHGPARCRGTVLEISVVHEQDEGSIVGGAP